MEGFDALPRVMPDTDGVPLAIVLENDEQEQLTVSLMADAKNYLKALEQDPDYLEAKKGALAANRSLLKYQAVHNEVLDRRLKLANDAVVAYRNLKRVEAAEVARRAAEVQAKADQKKRDDEAAKLEAARKKARGANRAAITQELEDVKAAPVVDVEVVALEAAQEVSEQFRGAGKGASVRNYFAVVEDLERLAVVIVATNPHLLKDLRAMVKAGEEFTPRVVPVSVLEGIKRSKGELSPSKALNTLAKDYAGKLNIPGVTVDFNETVRNT